MICFDGGVGFDDNRVSREHASIGDMVGEDQALDYKLDRLMGLMASAVSPASARVALPNEDPVGPGGGVTWVPHGCTTSGADFR